MGARRFRPLTSENLSALPEPCARCSLDNRDGQPPQLDWAESVIARWGYCGVLAVNDRETIGSLTMAPASQVPRLWSFATTPVSPDAAVLMGVWVASNLRGKGIGRSLVQSAAGLLIRRDIRALEAVGTYHDSPSCLVPAGWLESVGFELIRPHPVTPRYRMNLQTTVRWRPHLGAAWHRLTGLVTPQPTPPEPATRA